MSSLNFTVKQKMSFLSDSGLGSGMQILKLLLLGILIRTIFMPFASQNSDLMMIGWESHYISMGNLNIYQYFFDNYSEYIYRGDVAYLPPIYYLMGLWEYILSSLHLLNIEKWIGYDVLANSSSALFLLKMPFLLFDILAGLLIMRLVNEKNRVFIFALWMFNPVIIYTSYMWGQIDVIPAFFEILALYYASKSTIISDGHSIDANATLSVLALGASACFKNFQLILLLVFIIILSNKDLIKTLKLGLIGTAPYLICAAPFIHTAAFFNGVLMAPQNKKLFDLAINIGGIHISVFILLAAAALLYLAFMERDLSFDTILKYSLIIFGVFYITTNWHVQWFVWMMPFMILAVVKNWVPMSIYVAQLTYFCIFAASGLGHGAGLFHPLSLIFNRFKGLDDLIPAYDQFMWILKGAFIVISIATIYIVFKEGLRKDSPEEVQVEGLEHINLKIIAPLIILFAMLLFTVIVGSGSYIGIDQTESNMGAVEVIIGNVTVGQVFISDLPNLNGIEVYPDSYGRPSHGDLIAHLRYISEKGEMSDDIATAEISAGPIEENMYLWFRFPPLADSYDKLYYFFIESPNSTHEDAITLMGADNDVYEGGFAVVNHVALEGDLKFRADYKVDMGELYYIINNTPREGPFMMAYTLLIFILVALLISVSIWHKDSS